MGKRDWIYASKCMMDYASSHLGLTIFNAETHETNIRAIKMLDRIGFMEVSRVGIEEYLGAETKLVQYRLFSVKVSFTKVARV